MNNEIQRYTIYNCGCCSSAKPDECGAWCYYDDVIQIISQKNRKIEELKRENETLKAGRLRDERPEWVTDNLRNSSIYRRGVKDRECGHPPAEATVEYLAGYEGL